MTNLSPILRAARPYSVEKLPCCEFVSRILIDAYGLDERPGDPWWQQVNIWPPLGPWVGVSAVLEAPGGDEVLEPEPGHWHFCQGWRVLDHDGCVPEDGPPINGHTWLWWAETKATGVALESDVKHGPRLGGLPLARAVWAPSTAWASRVLPYRAGYRVVRLP